MGNSLGGDLAWEFCLAHPSQVNVLILIDAVCYPRDYTPTVLMLGAIPFGWHLFRVFTPKFLVNWGLKGAYHDHDRITPEPVDRYHDLILQEGNRCALLKTLTQKYPYGTDCIPYVQTPTLIMWGQQDYWIPPEHARLFARDLPHSRLIIHPDTGHAPMEEIQERTAADARTFLLKVSDQS